MPTRRTVNEVNLSLQPTLVIALSGNVPERTLYDRARTLQDAIETVPSVLEARLTGQRDELLEVIIDKQKLESYGVSQAELLTVVQRNNRLVAAGAVDSGNGRFTLKCQASSSRRRRHVAAGEGREHRW